MKFVAQIICKKLEVFNFIELGIKHNLLNKIIKFYFNKIQLSDS